MKKTIYGMIMLLLISNVMAGTGVGSVVNFGEIECNTKYTKSWFVSPYEFRYIDGIRTMIYEEQLIDFRYQGWYPNDTEYTKTKHKFKWVATFSSAIVPLEIRAPCKDESYTVEEHICAGDIPDYRKKSDGFFPDACGRAYATVKVHPNQVKIEEDYLDENPINYLSEEFVEEI